MVDTVEEEETLVIEGVQENDSKFRPSDWSERIASNWARFGMDHRLRYSPSIFPCLIDGVACLIIAKNLSQSDPKAYEFVMQFARENKLKVREDRRKKARDDIVEEQRASPWHYGFFKKR